MPLARGVETFAEISRRSSGAGFSATDQDQHQNSYQIWRHRQVFDGDCGPCLQLVADIAQASRVPREQIALCLRGHPEDAGDTGLGFRFALAAIADSDTLEALRAEIAGRYGEAAVVAAAFAASSGRVYPVLKRGLGYGAVCAKVSIGNETIGVTHPA